MDHLLNSKGNIMEIIPDTLLFMQKKVNKKEALKSNFIGLFFSAGWCPSCRVFLSLLMNFYKEVNKNEKEIEIIFNSFDEDIESFREHYQRMPWLAVPFEDPSREYIGKEYGISGIPYLIIFDKNGKLIEKSARMTIQNKGLASLSAWKAKAEAL